MGVTLKTWERPEDHNTIASIIPRLPDPFIVLMCNVEKLGIRTESEPMFIFIPEEVLVFLHERQHQCREIFFNSLQVVVHSPQQSRSLEEPGSLWLRPQHRRTAVVVVGHERKVVPPVTGLLHTRVEYQSQGELCDHLIIIVNLPSFVKQFWD